MVEGAHQGEWLGVAATGRRLSITGVVSFHLENGSIARIAIERVIWAPCARWERCGPRSKSLAGAVAGTGSAARTERLEVRALPALGTGVGGVRRAVLVDPRREAGRRRAPGDLPGGAHRPEEPGSNGRGLYAWGLALRPLMAT
jgi:hypothetical protein